MLSQLMMLFGFFALVLVLVYWVNSAVQLFDQLVADGQNLSVFLELTMLTLPSLIRLVVPISGFAAALYVTNRLTSDSELTVVQAMGYSPFRLARPVLLFGLLSGLLTGALTVVINPLANARLAERQSEIARSATARLLQEGEFLSPISGITLYIREITPEGELRDLMISDSRDPQETVTYTAASAYLVETATAPQLVMIDGLVQVLRPDAARLSTTRFEDFAYDLEPLTRASDSGRLRVREVPTWDLLRPTPELLTATERSPEQLAAEAHERIAGAVLAAAAPLIGFATLLIGGFSRFGVWRQILAAIGLIIIVQSLESVAATILRGAPGQWPVTYLPGVTGFAIATIELALAGRPRRRLRRRYPA
ncbi:LPS export ABC transporter permease LptF [Limimaricola hongkongensis]|uniref:Putative permease n=1 Tax=Limimaricola hongkongensis DSM 17492 TaxID=1122180 RepID=A0A017HIV4_9RHOB|nr:LPS export ABC transporter permease LptF [Limimaricola hongkongensis]EYD73719.1 putative permease [Limimaricola hongkongensis DSM 17492]